MFLRLSLLAMAFALAAVGCGVESMPPQLPSDVKVRPQRDVQAIQGGVVDSTSSNVVGILINANGGLFICTGSLIAPNLVLTAHHCVAGDTTADLNNCSLTHFGANFATSAFRVTMNTNGPANVFNTGIFPNVDNSQWFGVSAIAHTGMSICGGDMAVLRLSSNINSVCPLIPRVDSALTTNEGFTAVGFGATSPSQTAPAGTRYTLNGAMSVACPSNCGPGFNQTLEWYGQSNSSTRGVCEGDSGGPALDSFRRVTGTVSRGSASSCAQAVYESVYGHATWIKQQAQAAATAGGYTAAGWVTGASTTVNPCTGMDGGFPTGGGGGTTGGGGGATGGGTGGGGGTGMCPSTQQCFDASGMGDYACLSSTGQVPAGAPDCSATGTCAAGSTCWGISQTSAVCLVDCTGTGTGGGGGTTGGGGGATGGGGGTTMGSCTQAGTSCVDASGMGNFACVDLNSSNGIPAGAATCSMSAPCPANFGCWGTNTGNFCLQNCTTTGTGGGGGTTGGGGGGVGGGTGGGVPVGGGTGGGVPVGGGTGGGLPVGGGTGGAAGGGTGGAAGGGTGGAAGGGTGGAAGGGLGGGTGGAGAGTGVGGGFMFPGLPEQPKTTGCSCNEVPADAVVFALTGLVALARRRRARR